MAWTSLGRDTRERLTAACVGEGAVPLLTDRPAMQPPVGAMTGLALASSLLLGGVLTLGLRVAPSLGQSAVGIGAAGVLGGGIATQAALAARSWWLRGRLAFAGGSYLFARDLIVLRRESVRVVPTAHLTGVEYLPGLVSTDQGRVELRFEGGEFHELSCDQETGLALAEQITRLRDSLDEASRAGDLATLERLDPLWAERPRWADESAAAPARRTPHWLLSPWPSLALATSLGMAVGAGSLSSLSSSHNRQEVMRAIGSGDVATLERLAHSSSPCADIAQDALDNLTLRSSDPMVVLRLFEHRRGSSRIDERAYELALASPTNEALWAYRAIGGSNGARAEEELIRRTIATNTRASFQDYHDHGGMLRSDLDEAWQRLRVSEAVTKGDLRALRTLVEDPALVLVARDEAKRALQKAVASEDERLRTAHPGPLGALLRAALARQSVSVAPLRLVVRGEAPADALKADARTVDIADLDEVIRAQIASRLDATLPLELLRLDAHGRVPARTHAPALKLRGDTSSLALKPASAPRDELPDSDVAYLLADYHLTPAGHERVDARLTLTLHSPGSLSVAPVVLHFASVNPAVRGDQLFADALTDALQKSLDSGR